MVPIALVLAVLALIAAIFGFGLLQATRIGPLRLISYFLMFLAVAILALDIIQQQQAEENSVIQLVVE